MWFGQAMFLELIYNVVLFAVTGYALKSGGAPERVCAAVMIIGSLASTATIAAFHNHWHLASPYLFAVDCAALLAFLAIALTSDRFWPLYVAAFQIPSVVTHIATMLDPQIVPRAYAAAEGFWIYPMLIALVIGAHGHHKVRRAAER